MAFYALICVAFPIIGLMMGLAGSGYANVTGPLPDAAGRTALGGG